MTSCTYCGHDSGMHDRAGCRYDGAPALPAGLRNCRCPEYVEADEHVEAVDEVEPVRETVPRVPETCPCDWCG